MSQPIKNGEKEVSKCEEKFLNTVRETLITPKPNDACGPESAAGGRSRFTSDAEKDILAGTTSYSGLVATTLNDEKVQLNYYHQKLEDQANTGLLLCHAMSTQDAYAVLNYCIALDLVCESTELPKLLAELSKLGTSSAAEFSKIADSIKKSYDQICTASLAINEMIACIDKICNKDDKLLIEAEYNKIEGLKASMEKLIKLAEQATILVVQAASIFAQNNLSSLESAVNELKPQAEKFKKDIDDNINTASKSVTEHQKTYAESISSIAKVHGAFGKASTAKTGKQSTYCFIKQDKATMDARKGELLKLFDPEKKSASTATNNNKSAKNR